MANLICAQQAGTVTSGKRDLEAQSGFSDPASTKRLRAEQQHQQRNSTNASSTSSSNSVFSVRRLTRARARTLLGELRDKAAKTEDGLLECVDLEIAKEYKVETSLLCEVFGLTKTLVIKAGSLSEPSQFGKKLAETKTLQNLVLERVYMTVHGWKQLSIGLGESGCQNSTLKTLSLRHITIGIDAKVFFAEAAKIFVGLTKLSLIDLATHPSVIDHAATSLVDWRSVHTVEIERLRPIKSQIDHDWDLSKVKSIVDERQRMIKVIVLLLSDAARRREYPSSRPGLMPDLIRKLKVYLK